MEIRNNRTASYVCSLDPMSCVDMEMLKAIRKAISAANKSAKIVEHECGSYKDCKRVTVKGRDPIEKREINVNHWFQEPKIRKVGYTWAGDVVGGLANASRYDIYIHDDRRWI